MNARERRGLVPVCTGPRLVPWKTCGRAWYDVGMTNVTEITDTQTDLLREVIAWTRPQLSHLVEAVLAGGTIDRADAESIRTSLAYELYATGVDGDYEPNARGRELEMIIDWLGARGA